MLIMSAKAGDNAVASGVLQSDESCRSFSLFEMQIATNNFDPALLVGTGGFGRVYKGSIDNGTITVAIKRLKVEAKQGEKEFWTEVKMLSKLRHTNLVALIGYCNECEEMILVYEYIAHGTLADHLYKIYTKESDTSISHLTWEQRLQICVGSARGLDYLHTGTNDSVIHRDVKTTNILLDGEWVAKISDFGLSKGITSQSMTHVSTGVKGSFGYFDPDYFYTGRLTTKSDVFAFGVVLLEVLCGRPPVDRSLEEDQHSLVLWAQRCIKKGKLDRIIDPCLTGQMSPPCLKHFVEVANKCLLKSSEARPTMAEVVRRLELALASQSKGITKGIVTKMFKGIALVPKGMYHWWSWEGKDNNLNSELEDKDNSSKSKLPANDNNSKSASGRMDNNSNSELEDKDNSSKSKLLAKDNNSKSASGRVDKGIRYFSLAEILAATRNFNDNLLIARGDSGKVYRGFMEMGTQVVAIKIINKKRLQLFNRDTVEKRMLSLIRHDHIVSLIGFCDESGDALIHVYDYMANGSLQDHIYGTGIDPLVWKKRLEICIDAARGLKYLHAGGFLQDAVLIKSSNILLDKKMIAKIQINSSFNLSPYVGDTIGKHQFLPGRKRVNSKEIGIKNLKYFGPEYFSYGVLSKKSAVYSFGIVLVEVLCANEQLLSKLIYQFRSSNIQWQTIGQVTDPYLNGQIAPKCLKEFLKIANSCMQFEEDQRPSMDNVLESLLCALQLQEDWENQVYQGNC